MLSEQQRARLWEAYRNGDVRIQSVSPTGTVTWCRVLHVVRAEVFGETIFQGRTEHGSFTLTGGHRVFLDAQAKLETDQLQRGQAVCLAPEGKGEAVQRPLPSAPLQVAGRQYMYDLTADRWHNFVLHRSRLVISNSPDKFYRFRPPEHEGTLKSYNQVFGEIWEDAELHEYLQRSVDWWNSMPPMTCMTLDDIVTTRGGAWRTAILWGAIVHACTALALNWIADEFSVVGETEVRVHLPDGRSVDVSIHDLHEICKGAE